MPQQSVSDIFNAFVHAGFSQAQAAILTATSYYESTYNTTPPGGNGGGLLQFLGKTWKSTHVTCPVSDLNCQARAAYVLSHPNGNDFFPTVWFTAWFLPEAHQSGVTAGGYASMIASIEQTVGVKTSAASDVTSWVKQGSPTGPTGVVDPGNIFTDPGSTPGNIGTGVINAVTGGVLNSIGSSILSGAQGVGKAVLPWVLLLGIALFALIMFGRELSKGAGGGGGSTAVVPGSGGRPGGRGGAAEASGGAAEEAVAA